MTAAPTMPATPNEAACVGPALGELVAELVVDPVVEALVAGEVVVLAFDVVADVTVAAGVVVVAAGVEAVDVDTVVPPVEPVADVEPEVELVLPIQLESLPGLIVKGAD
jgi:hypothetical protein